MLLMRFRSVMYRRLPIASRMTYTTLRDLPKSQSFTAKLDLDSLIPSKEKAIELADSPNSEEYLNFTKRRILSHGAYSFTKPQDRKEFKFMMASDLALQTLGLDPNELQNPNFQKTVSGENYKTSGFFPYSQAYAGWQFGQFAGQLGDGRVVNLFEVTNDKGQRYELQLKGAGLTPFSRFADGKAVLRSSIREFVISESLHLIGIPTTRALAITMLPQTRAMRSNMEQCAIVCRMAESWIRLGTFDLYRMRNDREGIRKLSEYVLDEVITDFKEVSELPDKIDELTRFDKMYLEIVRRNALTVAKWQTYGFLNGVLNTDNTSILGLSIDFGPFAFMDRFDPDYTSNHDDHNLRYSFRETPNSIFWNLARLGEDLVELIGAGPKLVDDEVFIKEGVKLNQQLAVLERCTNIVQFAHDIYQKTFISEYYNLMSQRLGLQEHHESDVNEIHAPLLDILKSLKLDYNNFFVILQNLKLTNETDTKELSKVFVPLNHKETVITNVSSEEIVEELSPWLEKFKKRVLSMTDAQRYDIASKVNPLFIPRNWMLQEVIDYTEENDGDTRYLQKLFTMCINPYDSSKWGDFEKELESKWLQTVEDDKLLMSKCSCSS